MVCMRVALHENDGNYENDEDDEDNSDSYKQGVECWISGNHGHDTNHRNPGCKPCVPLTTGLEIPDKGYTCATEHLPKRAGGGVRRTGSCHHDFMKVCIEWVRMKQGGVASFQVQERTQRKGPSDEAMDQSFTRTHHLHRFHFIASSSQTPLKATLPVGVPQVN